MVLQLGNPGFGGAHPARAFEQERFGDDADGQHTHAARGFGDDGCGAGAGAPAHACRDEAHIDAFERSFDFGNGLLGGGFTHFGPRTCPKAAGDFGTKLDAAFGWRGAQRLRISIGDDEFDAFDLSLDHVGDGVAARAANPDNRDARTHIVDHRRSDIDAHQLALQAQVIRMFDTRPTLFPL